MLGYKWEHKLQKWVVFLKSTGKIISKHETEHEAKQALTKLRQTGEDEKLARRNLY